MRRKQEWKPKGQRRKPAEIKVEPFEPTTCGRCKKRETFAWTHGVGDLCWQCDQKQNPPSIGAPVLTPPTITDHYNRLCERAEKARQRARGSEETGDAAD